MTDIIQNQPRAGCALGTGGISYVPPETSNKDDISMTINMMNHYGHALASFINMHDILNEKSKKIASLKKTTRKIQTPKLAKAKTADYGSTPKKIEGRSPRTVQPRADLSRIDPLILKSSPTTTGTNRASTSIKSRGDIEEPRRGGQIDSQLKVQVRRSYAGDILPKYSQQSSSVLIKNSDETQIDGKITPIAIQRSNTWGGAVLDVKTVGSITLSKY
eukprot:GHVL01032012.1.p1 GENE.GHVL01032012.1~~GHVL01032012.1.p1  ORF type:complete len:218 (+),score=41.40 GHVL01032012.1:132-785(+)